MCPSWIIFFIYVQKKTDPELLYGNVKQIKYNFALNIILNMSIQKNIVENMIYWNWILSVLYRAIIFLKLLNNSNHFQAILEQIHITRRHRFCQALLLKYETCLWKNKS